MNSDMIHHKTDLSEEIKVFATIFPKDDLILEWKKRDPLKSLQRGVGANVNRDFEYVTERMSIAVTICINSIKEDWPGSD